METPEVKYMCTCHIPAMPPIEAILATCHNEADFIMEKAKHHGEK